MSGKSSSQEFKPSEHTPLLGEEKTPKSREETVIDQEKEVLTNFDQVLDHIGPFGLWQILNIAILWLPAIGAGILVLLWSFTGLEPDSFRCQVPECDIPGKSQFSDVNFGAFFENPSDPNFCQSPVLNSTLGNCSSLSQEQVVGYQTCDLSGEIIYGKFQFESTLVTELNLVCEDQYKVALTGTLYMAGHLVGSIVASRPTDSFGRKPVIIAVIGLAGLANLLNGFLAEYWSYVVFRTLTGVGQMAMVLVPFTLSMEIVGAKYQNFVGNMNQLVFAVGQALAGILAYYIRDWRMLHYVSSAFILPQILLWFVIPESPRWLITQGKWSRLKKELKTATKLNRANLPETIIIPTTNHDLEEVMVKSGSQTALRPEPMGWSTMITAPSLRWRSVIMAVNWAMVAMVYYGIGMSMTVLGGDIFVNFIASALVEMLAYVICILVTDHWGRKPVLLINFLVCGVACIVSAFLTDDNPFKLVLVLLGKLGSSGAFSTAWVYTAELFPTPIRGSAVGTCSTIGRLGSLAAPQLALFLPAITFQELPLIIFGGAALFSSVLTLFLPETLGHPLPDSLFEARQCGARGTKTLWSWWSNSRLKREVELQRQKNERARKTQMEWECKGDK